jgi:signal peptidase I
MLAPGAGWAKLLAREEMDPSQNARLNNCPAMPSWVRIVLFGRRPRFTLVRVLALIVGTFIVFPLILLPVRVQGPSMWPTYKEGRVSVVNRLAFLTHEPRRSDIVAIRFSGVSKRTPVLFKRIIALPGETVEFHGGHLFINGVPFDEPYVKLPCTWNFGPIHLKSDEYYVVGDNRSMPHEDHYKGAVERERIIGKVLL